MTENKETKKAPEYLIFALENPYRDRGENGYLTITVDAGFAKESITGADGKQYTGEKVEIAMPVPQNEAELQKFYEADFKSAMAVFVRTLGTRPNWKEIVTEAIASGKSREDAYNDLADVVANLTVKRGATVGSGGQKAKAKKAATLEAEIGLTMDQMIQAVALSKSQGISIDEAINRIKG